MLLVKAFELRHEDFEYAEKSDEVPVPLDKDSIMLLASVMISNESSGHLRDPEVINYLFKSVYELVEVDPENVRLFGIEDIA